MSTDLCYNQNMRPAKKLNLRDGYTCCKNYRQSRGVYTEKTPPSDVSTNQCFKNREEQGKGTGYMTA